MDSDAYFESVAALARIMANSQSGKPQECAARLALCRQFSPRKPKDGNLKGLDRHPCLFSGNSWEAQTQKQLRREPRL